jgi:hypothetical protein
MKATPRWLVEECRRCGKEFEHPGPDPQYVCDECQYADWHEAWEEEA